MEFGLDVPIGARHSFNGAKTIFAVDFNVDFLLPLDVSSIDDFCDKAKAKDNGN